MLVLPRWEQRAGPGKGRAERLGTGSGTGGTKPRPLLRDSLENTERVLLPTSCSEISCRTPFVFCLFCTLWPLVNVAFWDNLPTGSWDRQGNTWGNSAPPSRCPAACSARCSRGCEVLPCQVEGLAAGREVLCCAQEPATARVGAQHGPALRPRGHLCAAGLVGAERARGKIQPTG